MDYESALLLSYKTYLEYLEHTIKGQGLFVGVLSFLCSDVSPSTRRALWVLLCSPLYCSSLYLTPSPPYIHTMPYALHNHTFIQITMPYALYCHTFIQCYMPFTAMYSYNAICPSQPYIHTNYSAICPLLPCIHTMPYALYCHTITMPYALHCHTFIQCHMPFTDKCHTFIQCHMPSSKRCSLNLYSFEHKEGFASK